MVIRTVLPLILSLSCISASGAQELPDLMQLNLRHIPSNIMPTGGIDVRGKKGYELQVIEYGLQSRSRDHLAILVDSADGGRAVLQLGLVNNENIETLELNCEWRNKRQKDGHLIGFTNSKSKFVAEHYLLPYKAWLVDVDQRPPRFVQVKANLVQCFGGVVD